MKQQEMFYTLEWTKQLLDWDTASPPAKDWWEELESINEDRVDLVLKLAGELLTRHATIDDFFLACSYSNRDGVQENLRFLDVIRQDRSSIFSDEDLEDDDAPSFLDDVSDEEEDDDKSFLH